MNKSENDNMLPETLIKWITTMLNHIPSNPKELTLFISLLKSTNKSNANSTSTGKKPTSLSAQNTEKVKKSESSFMKINKESFMIDHFTWLTVSLLMSKKEAAMKSDSYLLAKSKNSSHSPSAKCLTLQKDFLIRLMSLLSNKKSLQ